MKRLFSLLFIASIAMITTTSQVICDQWRISPQGKVSVPAFSENKTVDGKKFDISSLLNLNPTLTNDAASWPTINAPADSIITQISGKNTIVQLAGYISSDRWTKATMTIATNSMFELYLNGKKIKSQNSVSSAPEKIDITIDNGNHQLLLKVLTASDTLRLSASIQHSSKDTEGIINWSINPQHTITLSDILYGESVTGASLSPSGKYLLITTSETVVGNTKNQSTYRVYDIENKRNVIWQRNASVYAGWMPSTDRLYYQISKGEGNDIYLFDPKNSEESLLASNIDVQGRLTWADSEDFFIFSKMDKADQPGDLKRIFTNDDRIPGTRNRHQLYIYNIHTKIVRQLTAGYQTAALHSIRPDGAKIVFSVSRTDYSEVPFSRQNLYEMDLNTLSIDTLWQDKLYSGWCRYSPDGTKLLVTGGPEVFGSMGVNVTGEKLTNEYDTQMFMFDIKTKTAEPLTLNFNPAVKSVHWAKNGHIYLTTTESDLVTLYRYDIKKRKFDRINVPEDIIEFINYAKDNPLAVFTGNSISSPQKLYTIDLKTGKSALISYPRQQQMKDIVVGKTEDWNFENKNGTTIYGRAYYPVNFDTNKKYPVIVYYYGGTTPTDRSFEGRYPKNLWAAAGYIVYVLQPSGTIGYGQDFSALHVNGWGREAIDDIIDGTQKFLEAHPQADASNVGCIGASYGGFTTMMLQTRTDIFKTAVAHAGISDITSYWGEGYWGYSYSTTATRESYPWNRKDIYVENSPLFNADKFNNSILLLHGTADTNVPVGESLQLYAALKILGKNVEMVLVDGQDHHIVDYKKRIEWHNTIMSWFNKMLKNQPEQWNEMYPDKNM